MTNGDGRGFGTRVVRVPVYWLVVGVVTCLLSPVLAIIVSVHINNKTIAENERQRAQARAASTQVICRLAANQLDAFSNAESDTGKASYRAWLDLYRLSKCTPVRK